MNNRTAFIITGMHRSGTSATARVCNLLGVNLAGPFMPPSKSNPAGYWESSTIVAAHDQLLGALGSSWNNDNPLPRDWRKGFDAQLCRNKILDSVIDVSASPLWGTKDPRIARLIPMWIDIAKALNCTPKFLYVIRNPKEVEASLIARRDRLEAPAKKVWQRYLNDFLEGTTAQDAAFVEYDDLLSDWRSAMSSVGDKLNITWPFWTRDTENRIGAFLNERHRHHRT